MTRSKAREAAVHTISAVSIKSNAQFEKMRAIGGIAARALRTMAEHVRAGMTTGERRLGIRSRTNGIDVEVVAPLGNAPA